MEAKTRVESVFELVWGVGFRLLLLLGIGYFVYRVRAVIVAVLLAATLTYAILPLVDILCKHRVRGIRRKTQRLIATILVFIVLISLGVSTMLAFFGHLEMEVTGIKASFAGCVAQIDQMMLSIREWHSTLSPDFQRLLSSDSLGKMQDRVIAFSSSVFKRTLDWLSHVAEVFLIPVLAFYFTLDSRSLKREFVALAPRRSRREALAILHEVSCVMRSYVIGQIILCLIAGIVVAAVLSLVGMDYVLLLSILSAVTRAIPIIGPIVAGAVIVLLATIKSPMLGLYMLIFFTTLHFAESKFIMPKLIGHRMQLHPALVIIVLLVGAEFFGILGMFLAAPAAAIVRTLIRYYIIKPKELRVWGLTNANSPTDPEALLRTAEKL